MSFDIYGIHLILPMKILNKMLNLMLVRLVQRSLKVVEELLEKGYILYADSW